VAKSIRIIQESGLSYKLGPMSTAIEGETWKEVVEVVEKCFQELQKDAERIYMTLQMDYRAGAKERLEGKIRSVEDRLSSR
jgi:uncharacterized protein (TIGR00106 family)